MARETTPCEGGEEGILMRSAYWRIIATIAANARSVSLLAAAFASACVLSVCGCATSDAIVITLSDSTNTQVLDLVSNDSLKVPALSYRSGPYFYCKAKRLGGWCYISGTAAITNETRTLFGMFEGREQKNIDLAVFIASASTNMTETADRTERSH